MNYQFKMPVRMVYNKEVLKAVENVFKYYEKKNQDFGYQGYFENKYTQKFVKYMGGKGYADAVATGTLALFVAISALELKPKSKVLVSPITDPGTLSAIIFNNLIPVLVDSKKNSYNVDLEQIKKRINPDIKAIIVVHAAGAAAPIGEIVKYAKKNNIKVIEDCSQAHGATIQNKKVGNFGDIAAFSTMYRKNHGTGGCGGVVFTHNLSLYKKVRAYSDRGKPFWKKNFNEKNPNEFLFPALNVNQDEISCAIGCLTIDKLESVRKKRLKFVNELNNLLINKSKTCYLIDYSNSNSPFFQTVGILLDHLNCSKQKFTRELQNKGIELNAHFEYVVDEWKFLKPYLFDRYKTNNARNCRNNSFNILLNENYGSKEAKYIVDQITELENKNIMRKLKV